MPLVDIVEAAGYVKSEKEDLWHYMFLDILHVFIYVDEHEGLRRVGAIRNWFLIKLGE